MSELYAGKEWLAESLGITELSPLGEKVADLLGDWKAGIYHLDQGAMKRVEWKDPRWMSIVLHGSLSTFDFDDLTRLVILCHARCVRLEIRPCTPRYLRFCFQERQRAGNYYERHPTMEQAITAIRKDYVKEDKSHAATKR